MSSARCAAATGKGVLAPGGTSYPGPAHAVEELADGRIIRGGNSLLSLVFALIAETSFSLAGFSPTVRSRA